MAAREVYAIGRSKHSSRSLTALGKKETVATLACAKCENGTKAGNSKEMTKPTDDYRICNLQVLCGK